MRRVAGGQDRNWVLVGFTFSHWTHKKTKYAKHTPSWKLIKFTWNNYTVQYKINMPVSHMQPVPCPGQGGSQTATWLCRSPARTSSGTPAALQRWDGPLVLSTDTVHGCCVNLRSQMDGITWGPIVKPNPQWAQRVEISKINTQRRDSLISKHK